MNKRNVSNIPLIQVNHLVKKYKNVAGEFLAVNDISLTIDKGEFVAIVGKSGSGKSTLLNMLSCIDHPSSGEIKVENKYIHSMSENEASSWRGKNLGIIFQFFQLMPTLSSLENVMLPMDFCNSYPMKERKDRAKALLEKTGILDHADKLPAALSGGQQQRVAIARALANDPDIILADEPTGNLDSNTSEEVFHLFEGLISEEKTIIMVTHSNDLANQAGRIISLQDGRVMQDGGTYARK